MRASRRLARLIGLAALLSVGIWLAHSATPVVRSQTERPFSLPFKDPPGPATWLMAQSYGNTVGAYAQRDTTYRNGQGLHFGIDFSAPCGTELVAMADGVVFGVDVARFGSAPHNLTIDHQELGYATFYGHLLRTPDLTPGQPVKAGEVVALSGDPAETCYGRPHLHLEIRDLSHVRKYNPVTLIQADWDNLALIGAFGQGFERDLEQPRRWQHLDDQPEVIIGGALLNDYVRPWPPDWRQLASAPATARGTPLVSLPAPASSPASAASPKIQMPASSAGSPLELTMGEPPALPIELRQLTRDGCCTRPFWSADSDTVLFIDKPTAEAQLGVWGVALSEPIPTPQLLSTRIGFYSRDMGFMIEVTPGTTVIEQLAPPLGSHRIAPSEETSVRRWTVPAEGRPVLISPGHRQIAWEVADQTLPAERRVSNVWVAQLDGSHPRLTVRLPRGSLVDWITDDQLLVSGRPALSGREQSLYAISLSDSSVRELARAERLRGASISPDGSWLAYFITFQQGHPEMNGLWVMRVDGSQKYRLPPELFGAYQWRDASRLLVIPLRPEAHSHQIWEVDLNTSNVRPLNDPSREPFKIANGDWQVAPDGRSVAFVESRDRNIWVIGLPE